MRSYTVHIGQIADLDKQEAENFLEIEWALDTIYWTTCTEKSVHKHYIETTYSKDGIIAKGAELIQSDAFV